MATFRVTIRKDEKRLDGTTNIKIRVCHNKKTRYVATDYYVLPKYFDKDTGTVKVGGPYSKDEAHKINVKLQIKLGVMARKADQQRNLRYMDINSLMSILRDKRVEFDMFSILDTRMEKFKKIGNINYHDTILRTKRAIEKFSGTSLLPFETIDQTWLTRFEYYLRSKGLSPNTIGIHMRDVRTAYNQAITMGMVDYSAYPFRKYRIPKEKTRHRTLTREEVATIARKEIKEPLTAWARDMYMLSFYLIGINMRDMMFIKNIEEGRIYYIRSKGKKQYSIKVWPEAMDIINKYPGKKYLLNTLDNYSDYRTAAKRINCKLKDIAELCGIKKPITTYYARHTWATIAKSLGVSKDDIRYALGHATNTVTDIYIDYEQDVVDQANRIVIDHIITTPSFE